MERSFGSLIDGRAVLEDEDVYRLTRTFHLRPGDEFELVADEHLFLMRIASVRPFEASLVKRLKEDRELKNDVVLAFSPIKGGGNEEILRLATELGAEEIAFLMCANTKAKIRAFEKEARLNWARSIAREAAASAKRLRIPLIYEIIPFRKLKDLRADVKLICYEKAAGPSDSLFRELHRIRPGERIAVLIGPEEGFAPIEVDQARAIGYHVVSLGKRSLTPVAASAAALGAISAFLEAS